MVLDKELINRLLDEAKGVERKRMNFDLRSSADENSQRMLNALLPGTVVPIHRHPASNENVILLLGKLDEVIYDAEGNEVERIRLDLSEGKFGCVIPVGVWHTVDVIEPSVIYESKDGAFGKDGSEQFIRE